MESINFTLIISNANEHTLASYGKINSSEVHRITLTNMSWIPGNMFVLINETMRQRLNLNFCKTLPSQHLHPRINNIIPSDDPYRLCENVYLSVDLDTYRLRSIAYPVLVPDLSVDFILGTLFFYELNLKWSASLKRLITRSEEEEEARRQTYRRIL
ncbi:unnamed protein product [Rotaria socialis]|uniref:Uncharacterized protein n=1 Tax=Rotaria socialis TaxID=392032 RepID=A0A818F5T9_9BILA|nr:unnamed protein product [Rotaria socialis]CAF4536748.1 unnamed protein product [Rotaria socialis]